MLELIAVDGDGPGGNEIFAAIEKQRDCLALHAGGLDREVDLELAAAKSKLGRAEFRNPHVAKALGLTDANGKHGHRERSHAVERLSIAVSDAVAEEQNRGLRRAVARGGLQQFD